MNEKWKLPLAALAVSLTMAPFASFGAEEEPPPPPPAEQREPGRLPPGPMREKRFPGLNQEERAKLDELNRKVAEALDAYRAEPNDTTRAALKERLVERFEQQQKFVIEHAEKMLAREKERLENKEKEVDRQLERMLRPRRERPDAPPRGEHMRPADRKRPGGPEGKRPEARREGAGPRGEFGRVLTPEEGRKVRELTRELVKAESVTPEVTAQLETLRAVYEKALERNQEALKAAKAAPEAEENGKRIEALERSTRFLSRHVESMKQPEQFLKQLKARAERRKGPDGAKRPEPEK